MNSEFNGYYDSVIVKPSSRRTEPALFLLREQVNYKEGGIFSNPPVPKDVPQMFAFDQGIRAFYIAYVYGTGNEQTKRNAESHFLHSIAYAAYDDKETAERKAKEYLDAELEGKTAVVLDMKQRFEDMTFPP